MKIFPFQRQLATFRIKKKKGSRLQDYQDSKKEILNSIILQSMNEAEREKELILNSLAERVCYLDLDYRIKWINSSGMKSIPQDMSVEKLLGSFCHQVLHGENKPCKSCPVETTLRTGWPWKEEISHADGSTYLVSAQPVFDDNGKMTGIIVVQLDISIRKEVERSLERSRMRSRALLDVIPDLLLVFNNAGIFIDYHPAPDFDLLPPNISPEGKNISDLIPPALAGQLLSTVSELLSQGDLRTFEYTDESEYDVKHYECRLVKTGDEENICIIRDVSLERNQQKDILYKSFHDSLTGLYNRAYFEEEISRIEHSRKVLPTSILFIDVNGLKFTNDAFGHEYGDKLLKAVADILLTTCRKSDVIARIGGDEFAIILPNSPLSKAEKLSARITKACAESSCSGFFARPSVSIGFAEKTDQGQDMQNIMKKADEKMYRIKLSNRKNYLKSLVADIAMTMKTRSDEGEEHIARCTELARLFAKRLDLTSASTDNIVKLAQFHDIGKIRIPKEILSSNPKNSPMVKKSR